MYETVEFRDSYSNMKVRYRVPWPQLVDLSGTLGSHEEGEAEPGKMNRIESMKTKAARRKAGFSILSC